MDYAINDFIDNGDSTVTDQATGLMWSQDDSGVGMNWKDALSWVQQKNDDNYLGYSDWRLPNAKELQSIVDYSRSPDTSDSASIDPIFSVTKITNEAGQIDYPFFWTGTTHVRYSGYAENAVYISFGRGLGSMDGVDVIDVHGAGCQRSDPKDGDPDDYPSWGNGPQGDVQRVFNYVRLVREGLTDNQAPEKPSRPNGPSSGEIGAEYTYTSSTTDPDNEEIYYWFDWGDNTNSGWLGPYDSGAEASSSHTWDVGGSYGIKVKAKDELGAQSEWSDSLPVSMPKNKAVNTGPIKKFDWDCDCTIDFDDLIVFAVAYGIRECSDPGYKDCCDNDNDCDVDIDDLIIFAQHYEEQYCTCTDCSPSWLPWTS